MAKNRIKQKANRAKKKKEEAIERKMSMKTNGYTDLTPYNAINGKDVISKATLSEVKTKVNGSFNG